MMRIRLTTMIDAPRSDVWLVVRDIGSHVRWMNDAEAIRFTSSQREGVGTTFECDSRLGPLRLVDHLEVIEWREGRAMTIRHVGKVRGAGRFTLKRRRGGTLFVWQEWLRFPWWLGGPVASAVTRPFFRRVWRKNLANLRSIVEAGPAPKRESPLSRLPARRR
jgi:hypothetical protein